MQLPPPASRESTLLRLRQATSPLHAAVEQRLQLDAPLTLERYVEVLRSFDAFLQSWEQLAAASLPDRLRRWMRDGLRHSEVRQDLAALGVPPPPPAPLNLALPTRAAAMGSLYVLEGSALGAQAIAPRISEQLGLGSHNGARFFNLDSGAIAARWRDFRFLLEQEVASPSARHQACAGAVGTLRAMLEVFDPGHETAPATSPAIAQATG